MTKGLGAAREWAKRLALVILSTGMAVVAGETGARIVTRGRYDLNRFRFGDWPDMGVFRPSRDLPYELAPVQGVVNSLGMRDREHETKKAPGIKRLAILCDSIGMYGHWPDILDERLSALSPRFEVWNWSIGGFGLQEYATLFERRAIRYGPDAVMIAFELMDVTPTRVIFRDAWGQFHCYRPIAVGERPADVFLYHYSYLYRMWMSQLEAREGFNVENVEKMEEFSRPSLRKIERLAVEHNVKIIAVIFPRLKPMAGYSHEEIMAWRAIRHLLDQERISYLDLTDVFPDNGREKFRSRPEDFIHFNAKGDKAVVNAVLPFLRRQLELRP